MKRSHFLSGTAIAAAAVAMMIMRATDPATRWPVRNDPPMRSGIVAFGDSLTDGSGVARDQSYPSQLEGLMGIDIVNLGNPGETTGEGKRRVNQVLNHEPGIVLLCLGGNDLLQRRSIDDQFRNLRQIIDDLQSDGILVILLGVGGHFMFPGDYNERYEALAKETGCAYVPDVLDGIAGSMSLTLPDKIHPNAEGYRLIAERVRDEAGQWLTN